MTVIKTKRLLLRPVEITDAPRFAELCNDPDIARNTARVPHPYTIEDAERFVRSAIEEYAEGKEYRFGVCRNDEIIACVGVMPTDANIHELGYWVGADYRRQGVATEAAAAAAHFAFAVLGAEIVGAGYFADNPASGRVLEKLGFQKTGVVSKMTSLGRGCEVDAVRLELRASGFAKPKDVVIDRHRRRSERPSPSQF